jgi:hypothetical protein
MSVAMAGYFMACRLAPAHEFFVPLCQPPEPEKSALGRRRIKQREQLVKIPFYT